MNRYYKNEQGKLFENPNLSKYKKGYLTEISTKEYKDELAIILAPKPLTPKQIRDAAMLEMEYDFGDGRIIQVRQGDFDLIAGGIDDGIDWWKMKDNKVYDVTSDELYTALKSGREQLKTIWVAHKALLPVGVRTKSKK